MKNKVFNFGTNLVTNVQSWWHEPGHINTVQQLTLNQGATFPASCRELGGLHGSCMQEHSWQSRVQSHTITIRRTTKLLPTCKRRLTDSFGWLNHFLVNTHLKVKRFLKPGLHISSGKSGRVAPAIWQLLIFIQLQANKLLHAFSVLHLGWAVGVILTWLAVGPLRLSHLLIHLRQSQPG